ncbi:glycosyl transferase family protein [Kutzneria sp. CA-103260]|nr:glycosyl transferase family protein [Kutzneria sp. CA-103260]
MTLPVNSVHTVWPAQVVDVAAPSGGNVYDRRVSAGLSALGWNVDEILVGGDWPRPDAAARAELASALDDLDSGEVVLFDGLVACGVPEIVVPAARRLRVVVLVHLRLAAETGLPPAVRDDLDRREREVLHAAHAVIATSEWAARELAEHHNLPVNRVHNANPGVDRAPLAHGTDGASRLLCVASVTPRKGHDLLLDALATIDDLDWHLVCVGALHHAPEHVARLKSSSAHEKVDFVGPQHGDELEQSYADADLFVLASRAETYGMVVTEALARGIPVLATDVDPLPRTVGHAPDGSVPGLLVPPSGLAAALRSWLTDAELRERLRKAARERRGMLDGWAETSKSLASVLTQVTRSSPPSG